MMRRGIAPAAFVAAVAVVGWLVTGVAALDVIRFLAYDIAFVALPGIALLWAVRGRRSGFLVTVALGWPIGQALEILAFSGTALIGARALFLLYPIVVILPSALAIWQRRRVPQQETVSERERRSAAMWICRGVGASGFGETGLPDPHVPTARATARLERGRRVPGLPVLHLADRAGDEPLAAGDTRPRWSPAELRVVRTLSHCSGKPGDGRANPGHRAEARLHTDHPRRRMSAPLGRSTHQSIVVDRRGRRPDHLPARSPRPHLGDEDPLRRQRLHPPLGQLDVPVRDDVLPRAALFRDRARASDDMANAARPRLLGTDRSADDRRIGREGDGSPGGHRRHRAVSGASFPHPA